MSRNFFTDKPSMRTIDLRRISYFIITVLFFILTETGRYIYRPFIYSNNIDDYGLADSIGNLGGIVVQIFFMLTFFNSPKKKGFRIILFMVFGYILYEAVQPYLPKGVFDWKDIYATIIGGFISYLILMVIHATIKNKKIYEF